MRGVCSGLTLSQAPGSKNNRRSDEGDSLGLWPPGFHHSPRPVRRSISAINPYEHTGSSSLEFVRARRRLKKFGWKRGEAPSRRRVKAARRIGTRDDACHSFLTCRRVLVFENLAGSDLSDARAKYSERFSIAQGEISSIDTRLAQLKGELHNGGG
eukprot:CAMPEP_0170195970 /NCGR_PEP_ID=MMETSP0040_2-20121228/62720_1 /TAXON_ID=641309 /ORGANISM="Lotharella oceanica, Strain CCMP622" /LENGTH=155 /DNA_ID=CAMNT_0010445271 /DNA_START=52 /DNA_END=515 /DNA_ORIENTATION=+